MLQEVLLRGEMSRGEVAAASGLKRAGREILAQLVEEGILVSNMPKAPVRLAFPTHLGKHFPQPLSPGKRIINYLFEFFLSSRCQEGELTR